MELIIREDIKDRICPLGWARKIGTDSAELDRLSEIAKSAGANVDIVFERSTFRAVLVAFFENAEDNTAFRLTHGL